MDVSIVTIMYQLCITHSPFIKTKNKTKQVFADEMPDRKTKEWSNSFSQEHIPAPVKVTHGLLLALEMGLLLLLALKVLCQFSLSDS